MNVDFAKISADFELHPRKNWYIYVLVFLSAVIGFFGQNLISFVDTDFKSSISKQIVSIFQDPKAQQTTIELMTLIIDKSVGLFAKGVGIIVATITFVAWIYSAQLKKAATTADEKIEQIGTHLVQPAMKAEFKALEQLFPFFDRYIALNADSAAASFKTDIINDALRRLDLLHSGQYDLDDAHEYYSWLSTTLLDQINRVTMIKAISNRPLTLYSTQQEEEFFQNCVNCISNNSAQMKRIFIVSQKDLLNQECRHVIKNQLAKGVEILIVWTSKIDVKHKLYASAMNNGGYSLYYCNNEGSDPNSVFVDQTQRGLSGNDDDVVPRAKVLMKKSEAKADYVRYWDNVASQQEKVTGSNPLEKYKSLCSILKKWAEIEIAKSNPTINQLELDFANLDKCLQLTQLT